MSMAGPTFSKVVFPSKYDKSERTWLDNSAIFTRIFLYPDSWIRRILLWFFIKVINVHNSIHLNLQHMYFCSNHVG
jgi:hypothetical protein